MNEFGVNGGGGARWSTFHRTVTVSEFLTKSFGEHVIAPNHEFMRLNSLGISEK